MSFIRLTILGLLLTGPVFGQKAISVRAGLITGAEGSIYLENNPLKFSADRLPSVAKGQRLSTRTGRVEMQLGLGSVLRMGENAALRLTDSRLEDVQLQIESGSVLVEIFEKIRSNKIKVHFGNALIAIEKTGLYRLDARRRQLSVYGGSAEVVRSGKKTTVKRGQAINLADSLGVADFDRKQHDQLHKWSARRSFELYRVAPMHWDHWAYNAGRARSKNYEMEFPLPRPVGRTLTHLEMLQQLEMQRMIEAQRQQNEDLETMRIIEEQRQQNEELRKMNPSN
jgi:hypothetical protein